MTALARTYTASDPAMVALSSAMAAELYNITGIEDQTAVVVRQPLCGRAG